MSMAFFPCPFRISWSFVLPARCPPTMMSGWRWGGSTTRTEYLVTKSQRFRRDAGLILADKCLAGCVAEYLVAEPDRLRRQARLILRRYGAGTNPAVYRAPRLKPESNTAR